MNVLQHSIPSRLCFGSPEQLVASLRLGKAKPDLLFIGTGYCSHFLCQCRVLIIPLGIPKDIPCQGYKSTRGLIVNFLSKRHLVCFYCTFINDHVRCCCSRRTRLLCLNPGRRSRWRVVLRDRRRMVLGMATIRHVCVLVSQKIMLNIFSR